MSISNRVMIPQMMMWHCALGLYTEKTETWVEPHLLAFRG